MVMNGAEDEHRFQANFRSKQTHDERSLWNSSFILFLDIFR